MSPLERIADSQDAIKAAMEGNRASMWTTLPGIIVSFDPDKMTVVVQPAIKGVIAQQDGTSKAVNLPVLPDVPVVFPHGGGCSITFPLEAGDECLVVFSARCIDAWYQSGGIQMPMVPRMHDLSDGFCIPGPWSQKTKLSGVSTTELQIRSDDGAADISLNPSTHLISLTTSGDVTADAGGDVSVMAGGDLAASATGNITITAGGGVTINASGDVAITASGNVDVTGSTINLN